MTTTAPQRTMQLPSWNVISTIPSNSGPIVFGCRCYMGCKSLLPLRYHWSLSKFQHLTGGQWWQHDNDATLSILSMILTSSSSSSCCEKRQSIENGVRQIMKYLPVLQAATLYSRNLFWSGIQGQYAAIALSCCADRLDQCNGRYEGVARGIFGHDCTVEGSYPSG